MSLDTFIMPILALIAGIIALFTNIKKPKTKWWLITILLTALSLTCILEIYFKQIEKQKNEEQIHWGQERIKELSSALSRFEENTINNFNRIFALLKDETERFVKEEPPSTEEISREEIGFAYYGLRNYDNSWSSRYFRKASGNPSGYPSVGDIIIATSNVNARAGYIQYIENKGWVNQSIIGLIKPNDELEVLEVHSIFNSFIWIKFKRL